MKISELHICQDVSFWSISAKIRCCHLRNNTQCGIKCIWFCWCSLCRLWGLAFFLQKCWWFLCVFLFFFCFKFKVVFCAILFMGQIFGGWIHQVTHFLTLLWQRWVWVSLNSPSLVELDCLWKRYVQQVNHIKNEEI